MTSAPSPDSISEPGKLAPPPPALGRATPAKVLARLRAYYGAPEPRRSDGPLAELVQTILSQNTSDVNTERAFASLWARFGASLTANEGEEESHVRLSTATTPS